MIATVGCSRTRYRLKADRDTYRILSEKTVCAPWQPPPGFSIQPDPRSRFCDPSPPDDPLLPIPSPRLYGYRLPQLPSRDPGRFRAASQDGELLATTTGGLRRLPPVEMHLPINPHLPVETRLDPFVQQAAYYQGAGPIGPAIPPVGTELRVAGADPSAGPFVDEAQVPPADVPEGWTIGEDRVVPIPQAAWQSLPASCLIRMFEFGSIRDEYERTAEYERAYRRQPAAPQRDDSQRLSLEDIVELALINSREYQTQKEALYRVALRLTLARFDYEMKFSTGGDGTAANYLHNRNAGITDDTLSIPTRIGGDKLLATGGDLLARFANSVVLTFNGPQGFAADIGSVLLLDISQTVFQRDVVFERLTQAERDVVYAARDFIRFRKELFRDLAFDYYGLILTYRGIEIATQDYFSFLRAFNEGEAEYQAGLRSRIEVDQVEQDALSSRSRLISACNSLESGLDRLKLRIGLPPELPVNLDLTELEELTLRDEATVSGERVRRARTNLLSGRQQPAPDRAVLLNGAIQLAGRMVDLSALRGRLGQQTPDLASLEILRKRLSVDEARQRVRYYRQDWTREKRAVPPSPPVRIFRGTLELVDALLNLVDRQLELAAAMSADPATMAGVQRGAADLRVYPERLYGKTAGIRRRFGN